MSNRIDLTWLEGDENEVAGTIEDTICGDYDYVENLLAELKRCYEEMDKVTRMVADFSNRCEQAEYTDVGEVWDLLNALMKNLASE